MDSSEIGPLIKKARIMRALTQQQLADKAGVTKATIGMLERDEVNLSMDKLLSICNVLKVEISFTIKNQEHYPL